MLQIKVVNKGHQPLPQYATAQSAGMDLRANLDAPVVLKPMERRLIPTGLHIALPAGYEAQVRPRSGLALKKGITVLNSPGTVDADYRGEVGVLLINLSQEDFIVKRRRAHRPDGYRQARTRTVCGCGGARRDRTWRRRLWTYGSEIKFKVYSLGFIVNR